MPQPINTPSADILRVMRSALSLRSHNDLFLWLQRDVRTILPHDAFIAAWGNFAAGKVSYDVVSALPGLRTTAIRRERLLPLLLTLFDAWREAGSLPFATAIDGMRCDGCRPHAGNEAWKCLAGMNGALVHGIRDERGWYDCLYVALGGDAIAGSVAVEAMELLLPSIDAAFRKVAHLPMQRGAAAGFDAETHHASDTDGQPGPKGEESGLTGREREIMYWVSVGKTNPEIGLILNISPSTVRNHLQRIFRKLGVINRAQAVSRLEQTANGGGDC